MKSRDIRVVQLFLEKNFTPAATSDYAWLHELDEAGYSKREIAELLLMDIGDSPWIYFAPRLHVRRPIQTDFHAPGCAHQMSSNTEPPSIEQEYSYSPPTHTEVRRLVEELCGIGGVVPSSKDASNWNGNVTFEEQSSVSFITFAADSAIAQHSRNELVVKISNVLANFCTAVAAVQALGLCCDSFTVLLRTQDCLRLRRVDFRHASAMSSKIDLVRQDNDLEEAVQQCVQSAKYILRELSIPIPNTTPNADLHYCALAAQFLCSAFLSYIQAHVGSIDPFFLDRPQHRMVLFGSLRAPGNCSIVAELVKLTCFADMTQQPVFAFSLRVPSRELRLKSEVSRFDVLTNAVDCLDTWGPGYCVYNKENPSKIHAVAVGGGFVSLIDSKDLRFHWAKRSSSESVSWIAFEMSTIMRIGAAVRVNERCSMNEALHRENPFHALEQLGTHNGFWEAQERQAGFQGGQYLIGTYCQIWNKVRGITLKQCALQQADWCLIPFLEQSWGL